MTSTTPSPAPPRIFRHRDQPLARNDRAVRRALDAGTLTRVATGAFIDTRDWQVLTPLVRHRLRVQEVVRRTRGPVVVSFFAAAAVHGIDILGSWPEKVDVTTPRASGGRSSGAIRRRALGLEHVARIPWSGHEVTTPAQTALDLARVLPFMQAVCIVDQAICTARPGGPLTSIDEIATLLRSDPRPAGRTRARRALEFADSGAANVRETQARVVVASLGYPRPRTQERRVLASGRVVYGDLYFPEYDHWCEIDGRGKYLDPQYRPGRDPRAVVIDEKNRENEIRREVRGFSRWEATDADDPARIWDILTADGMPRLRPRP